MAKKDGDFDLVLDYDDCKKLITTCILAKAPVMIHGSPGIGKSDLVKEIGGEIDYEVIDIRLALLESVDIKGYPYLSELEIDIINDEGKPEKKLEKVLSFAMNKEFPRHPTKKVILFFDEINAAAPSTQLAMYQLILDREIGEYKLPENVSMVAAGNRGADAAGIFSMPKPLENRFCHVELQPSFKKWVMWAIGSTIHPEIVGYLSKNEQDLNQFDPRNSSRAFATPRTWAKASQLMNISKKASDEDIQNLISSCVGVTTAMKFSAYRKIAHELPSVDDIFAGKNPPLRKASIDLTYMLVTNAMHKIREQHQEDVKTGLAKPDSSDIMKKMNPETADKINNFFQYILDNEEKIGAEFLVISIHTAFKNYKLPIAQKNVPAIVDILKKTKNLMSMTFEM